MRPLTDLEVLALLCAAPVDADAMPAASGDTDAVKPGHAAPWESASAWRLFAASVERGLAPHASIPSIARAVLARVFDLPPRETDEPIVIALARESDAAQIACHEADRKRIDRAQKLDAMRMLKVLDSISTAPDGTPLAERVEALCAEVLELRANAAALLRADVGPESERTIVEDVPFIDPEELAEQEALRAAYATGGPDTRKP